MSGIVPRQRAAAPSAPGRIRGRTHLAGAILNSLRLARAGLVLAQHGVSFVPRGMKVPPALVAARLLTAPVRWLTAPFRIGQPKATRISSAIADLGPSYIKLG